MILLNCNVIVVVLRWKVYRRKLTVYEFI